MQLIRGIVITLRTELKATEELTREDFLEDEGGVWPGKGPAEDPGGSV